MCVQVNHTHTHTHTHTDTHILVTVLQRERKRHITVTEHQMCTPLEISLIYVPPTLLPTMMVLYAVKRLYGDRPDRNCVFYCHSKNPWIFISVWSILVRRNVLKEGECLVNVFMPLSGNNSGRLYDDFLRLLFLHSHRDGSVLARESDQFRFLRSVCLAHLKGSVDLILAKSSPEGIC